ncbi:MAG: hypothetical protein AB7T32_17880, partial [Dehalococcoidia bacterium]
MKLLLFLFAASVLTLSCSAKGDEGSSEPGKFTSSLTQGWKTDFSKAVVSQSELTQGQIKNGIPALSSPKFLGVS